MKKILLTGAGFRNKGSAAMIASVHKSLQELFPHIKFVLASNYPKFDACRAKQSKIRIFDYQFTLQRNFKPILSLLSELKDTNIVIDLSGFGFSDKTRKMGILVRALTILLCKISHKPIILYSQSLGPFNRRFTRLVSKICLPRAQFICVRGEVSKGYLNGIGIKENVLVYADSAFLLEPASQERLDEILCLEGMSKQGRPRVGIAVNARVYERTPGFGPENHYVNVIAKLSDFLIENMNVEIVFVPYETGDNYHDDRFVAEMIYRKARAKQKIFLINSEYDSRELKAFNQIFDLFIGSRFHSIIASTSMLVPTIAIGWGPKYFEIMQTLGQEKYVIDHKSLSLDPLVDIVSFAWNQRILIKRDLKDKIELMKKSATENVKLVARMISNE